MTHICVGKIIIIGSDNGLSPDRRQAIIWINAGFLSMAPLRTYFSEHLIKVQPFSLKKMHVKMSSAKWRPSCFGLNVLLTSWDPVTHLCINDLDHHWLSTGCLSVRPQAITLTNYDLFLVENWDEIWQLTHIDPCGLVMRYDTVDLD